MTQDQPKRNSGGELRPCFHEGAERDYIVCDSCLRRWNTEFSSMVEKVERLRGALSEIANDPVADHNFFAREALRETEE